MPFFHPRTLLDKTYEIGIVIKGIDGTFEIIAGLLLWLITPATVDRVTRHLTHNTLAHDPHNALANHILSYGHQLSTGHTGIAVLFLLSHGIVKVSLVTALLLQKMWAYPWALVLLTLFLVYQAYLLITQPSFMMVLLTVLDAVIIWLVWREWHVVQQRQAAKHAAAREEAA